MVPAVMPKNVWICFQSIGLRFSERLLTKLIDIPSSLPAHVNAESREKEGPIRKVEEEPMESEKEKLKEVVHR